MTLEELFVELWTNRIELRRDGTQLRIRAAHNALNDTLVGEIRAHKDTLLEIVGTDSWWSPLPRIAPAMLPLINLTQDDIDRIVAKVPEGAANIQDIYALSPLQDGILFHHLLASGGDPYLIIDVMAFPDRARLDRYFAAIQRVIDRHDILRTAFHWEALSTPAQVVLRRATLSVTEVSFHPNDGPVADQLMRRFDPRHHRIDLSQAPLLRFYISQEPGSERWIVLQLQHHIIGDHSTLESFRREVAAILNGKGDSLPVPQPFRNLVAHTRLGRSSDDHERFFRKNLADIDEPALPFGLSDVLRDGDGVVQSGRPLPQALSDRLREHARRMGVSLASLCHLAWGQVIARTSGRESVVFGTILFGRMHTTDGSDEAMGLFINTLPLRLDLDSTPLSQAVRNTHEKLAALLEHEHASLALAQRCSGIAAGTPLFSSVLNYRHSRVPTTTDDTTASAFADIEWLHVEERSNYPLAMSVEDYSHSLGLTCQVVNSLSPDRVCGLMQRALEHLADALHSSPDLPVQQLDVLPSAERELLLRVWNQTDVAFPQDKCIHQLFEEQVAKTPDAVAVVQDDVALTYAELNALANRFARRLVALGVRPDSRVAICVGRRPHMLVGLLAILKAGGAYVPLDPTYPVERLAELLADAEPCVLLSDSVGLLALGQHTPTSLPVIALDQPLPDGANDVEDATANLDPRSLGLSPSHLSYVIYTSGSTGKPKGVMVEHRNVVNLVAAANYVAVSPDDVFLHAAPLAFDASTFELWGALLHGARVALLRPGRVDPEKLAQALDRHHVSILFLTTVLFEHLCNDHLSTLARVRQVLMGGELMPLAAVRLALSGMPHKQLTHVYGPTETTTFATFYPFPKALQNSRFPIGRPIANTRVYLLDRHRQPVPQGVVGEIFIGGAGVARGYLNRLDLTAERFFDDPFTGAPGARMYRTGDLARYLPDGNIEFLGRNDHQVKLRGFRIELGEIEARLGDHPAVREAIVLAREDSPGDKRLVAYVTPQPYSEFDPGALRDYLAPLLPEYMVPAAFVRLDTLPLTSNGKIDRKALPAPDALAVASSVYEPPQGHVELTIAAIWTELLHVDRVGRHDNFFELGGHSLLAVRLLSRLQSALSVSIPLPTIHEQPTLSALADAISQSSVETLPPIARVSRNAPLSLSFAQQRLWFLAQLEGVSATYNIPAAIRLSGRLDHSAWRRSLDSLVARHEALRTRFVAHEGVPHVALSDPESGFALLEHDLSAESDPVPSLRQLCSDEASAPFDLSSGPLIRGRLIRLAPDEHVFLLTQHHIVSDGWSIGVLSNELSALYRAFALGHDDPLPPLPTQYPDFAVWQRNWLSGERLKRQADYWREQLGSAPVLLELPTDRPRPEQQSFAGADVPVSIDAELSAALKQLSLQHGTTLFMTLLAAWAVVLSRLSGQHDIVIGTPTANRNRHELESLVGFFVNTLALRIDLSDNPSVEELLACVRKVTLGAQDHEDLPFEQVVDIVQPPRSLAHSPLFQVMFAWQNNEAASLDLPGIVVEPFGTAYEVSKFDLLLSLSESPNGIVGTLGYATALFDASTIERHRDYFVASLRAMVSDARQPVARIDILPTAERELLLRTWNQTEAPFPQDKCIHQLFEEQVDKTPDAVAVSSAITRATYRELNARANRIGHRLRRAGIGRDAIVALYMPRSPSFLALMLGVMKAGGAYLPLDVDHPAARVADVVRLAATRHVVCDQGDVQRLQEALGAEVRIWTYDELSAEGECDANLADVAARPADLAYVIFTSGSTGIPKGAMVEQIGMVNHLFAKVNDLGLAQDSVIAQTAPVCFDISVWQFLSALLVGGRVHVVEEQTTRNPVALFAAAEAADVTVLEVVPSLLRLGLDEGLSLSSGALKCLLLTGEALPPKLCRAWFERHPWIPLVNAYGPTECSDDVTHYLMADAPSATELCTPIGEPIPNTRLYVVDRFSELTPLGVPGELLVGGICVGRGYLGDAKRTRESFVRTPLDVGPVYRTGNLVRWRPDGNLEFLGRLDHQVKIRGFRIELGEIEARLSDHPAVRDAVVLAREDVPGDKRLVAYVTSKADSELEISALRDHLARLLPDYMVPTAFVRLDSLPLTPNGKLDRKALPPPDALAVVSRAYEPPLGHVELALATIWAELLHIDRVGRHDNFFELGGHSLLAVQMIARLRRLDLALEVRALFAHPVLSHLAATLGSRRDVPVPPNVLSSATTVITPADLPLITFAQDDIDRIVDLVPGGVANIQDIYALSPLQDGILFHHLLASEGDPYLLATSMAFDNRALFDRYLEAVQLVVDRHDILRTSFHWEGLSTPAQVVWRHASLSVTDVSLDPSDGPITDQLSARFDPRRHRIDLSHAPLLRFYISQEPGSERWIVLRLHHHLIGDHATLATLQNEVAAILSRKAASLAAPQPFRNLVAHARLGLSPDEHEHFFRKMLADIDEPTLPFGLTDVLRDGDGILQARRLLPQSLNTRLRDHARRLGVSLASLCHLAWGTVLARATGRESVVFGTVLFGRMHAGDGSDQAMGLFMNTLPLRLDIDATPLTQAVQDTHHQLAALLEHEHASLALAQRCSGVVAPAPLFSALLNYRHNHVPAATDDTSSAYAGIEYLRSEERTNYPLTLSIDDFSRALGLTCQVTDAISPDRVCDFVQRALEQLADALESSPELPVRQLDVLPTAERELLLRTWNQTEAPFPQDKCIHQLFEEQVEKSPDAIAVSSATRRATYRELNARANRIGHQLRRAGIGRDAIVALYMPRSPSFLALMLGVMKAGGAYLPLDVDHPAARVADVVRLAATRHVVCDQGDVQRLQEALGAGVRIWTYDELSAEGECEANLPDMAARTTDLAYVIFTSGSTGIPKGAMVEQIGMVNHLFAKVNDLGLTQDSVIAQTAPVCFDISVWQFLSALLVGGRVHVVDEATTRNPIALFAAAEAAGVTVLEVVPSLLRLGLDEGLSVRRGALKHLLLTGEALPPKLCRAWFERHPWIPLVNAYGPTECSDDVTHYMMADAPSATELYTPIGEPIPNTRLYVVDRFSELTPLGVPGELLVGGICVGRGYLGDAKRTRESFVRTPLDVGPVYRTGDLVRWRPDGNLEFLGRLDHQVKIRGFRIELGEIEARLSDHPAVRDAVVLAREDVPGDKRLVAYVTSKADSDLEISALRDHLARLLPDYMVPTAFVRLQSLPLTPNGKLDRKALPPPDALAVVSRAYEPPQGHVELTLATIWAELLHLDRVGRHDNFFELGGHSLLAVQMIARLRRLGLRLEVRALFAHSVLSDLAATLGSRRDVPIPPNVLTSATTVITPADLPLITFAQDDIDRIVDLVPGGVANIQDIYALSPFQEGILFHHLLASDGDPYLLEGQMTFDNRAVLDRYLEGVQLVVDRHDILRTSFHWEGLSTPAQVVWRHASLSVTEVALDPNDGPVSVQLSARFDPRHHRIDLAQPPLMRFYISQEPGSERWIVLQLLHHLISDYSTVETLRNEVAAISCGKAASLPPPTPFRNLIAHARLGLNRDEQERFFRKMLADIDEPTLPFGLTDVLRDGDGVVQSRRHLLPQSLDTRLREQARRLGVSLASLCHLAWGQVLARATGRESVVFGTVVVGRMQAGDGSDQAMGPFINTLPLRLDIDATPLTQAVQNAYHQLAALLEHEHASLALAQRCSGVVAPAPLFGTLLTFTGKRAPVQGRAEGGESPAQPPVVVTYEERTIYPVTLYVEDFSQALGLSCIAVNSLSPDRVCDFMQRSLEQLADALESSPELPIRQLDVLPLQERDLLLHTWNQTSTPFPSDKCIHHLFEEQVAKAPDAIAVVQDDVALTYRELNALANRFAHRLVALGVRPDSRVAICVDRRPYMLVGLLGILKAGGAYVPLDPTYPPERLAELLSDSQPCVLLSDSVGLRALGQHTPTSIPVLALDQQRPAELTNEIETSASLDPRSLGLSPSHLAYVIYTSGSTGKPKGVAVEHRNVVNLAATMQQCPGFAHNDTILAVTTICFDIAALELFVPLISGSRIELATAACAADGFKLRERLAAVRPTVMQATPSTWRMLMATGWMGDGNLRVLCGGDALPGDVAGWLTLHVKGLWNLYGPTETTVWSSVGQLAVGDGVTIGRPIANTRIYLLDAQRQPVPLGVVGEIYIGGAGVARGYLNRPDLTAERFLDDPFSDAASARIYRTGDLARYLPNGNLEFLGRNDHQIKLRGFRIELGDIEARLGEHPAIRDVVVLAREDSPDDKRLVAYFTSKSDADIEPAALRDHLARLLPDYMVPAAFVRLESFPLTPNGKLDRKALPAPEALAVVSRPYEPPEGDVELALAAIWSDLLHVGRVGRHDNFFELGGHSLRAVEFVLRVARNGFHCTLHDLFGNPVLKDLAHVIATQDRGGRPYRALPVRRQGAEPPLFFVPSGTGDYSYAFELARDLNAASPIYALPWPPLESAADLHIEALATNMVSLIRAVQPVGPYRLAGYSSGGILAYAIAQHFLADNEEVSFVGLIDVMFPYGDARHASSAAMTHAMFFEQLSRSVSARDRERLRSLRFASAGWSFVALVDEARRLELVPPEVDADPRAWERIEAFATAYRNYQPPPINRSIHIFYATERMREASEAPAPLRDLGQTEMSGPQQNGHDADNPSTGWQPDPYCGWQRLLPVSAIRSHAIPGDHGNIMASPTHRAALAAQMVEALRNHHGRATSRSELGTLPIGSHRAIEAT